MHRCSIHQPTSRMEAFDTAKSGVHAARYRRWTNGTSAIGKQGTGSQLQRHSGILHPDTDRVRWKREQADRFVGSHIPQANCRVGAEGIALVNNNISKSMSESARCSHVNRHSIPVPGGTKGAMVRLCLCWWKGRMSRSRTFGDGQRGGYATLMLKYPACCKISQEGRAIIKGFLS